MKNTLFIAVLVTGTVIAAPAIAQASNVEVNATINQANQIKFAVEQGIASQIKAAGEYDTRLEEILAVKSQSQLSTEHPEFSAYAATLPYSQRFYNLSDYENVDALVADVVEKTFRRHSVLFPDAENADPRHEASTENKHGYRYAVVVEDLGNGSYKINTVIAPDRETTERGY